MDFVLIIFTTYSFIILNYNKTMTKLYFNSKSKDASVGRGVYESIVCDEQQFKELSQIKDWRKILSNFAITPFLYQDLQWNTVEHAFQAQKYRDVNYDLYYRFSLNSGTELSRSDGSSARKNRKLVIMNAKQIILWNSVKINIMKELWFAKFTQNELARRVLCLTQDAELWHGFPRSSEKVRLTDLEDIRKMFQK